MLYVECTADEALARGLGLRRRQIRHELNKDEVLKRLMEESNSLGMVDEDPDSVPPAQFGRMLKRDDYSLLGIVLYINSSRNNQAIVLQPNLEGWIIRTASENGIQLDVPRYNLPSSPKSLHRVVNKNLDKLHLLIDDLLSANSPRILRLQALLTG